MADGLTIFCVHFFQNVVLHAQVRDDPFQPPAFLLQSPEPSLSIENLCAARATKGKMLKEPLLPQLRSLLHASAYYLKRRLGKGSSDRFDAIWSFFISEKFDAFDLLAAVIGNIEENYTAVPHPDLWPPRKIANFMLSSPLMGAEELDQGYDRIVQVE